MLSQLNSTWWCLRSSAESLKRSRTEQLEVFRRGGLGTQTRRRPAKKANGLASTSRWSQAALTSLAAVSSRDDSAKKTRGEHRAVPCKGSGCRTSPACGLPWDKVVFHSWTVVRLKGESPPKEEERHSAAASATIWPPSGLAAPPIVAWRAFATGKYALHRLGLYPDSLSCLIGKQT